MGSTSFDVVEDNIRILREHIQLIRENQNKFFEMVIIPIEKFVNIPNSNCAQIGRKSTVSIGKRASRFSVLRTSIKNKTQSPGVDCLLFLLSIIIHK